MRNRTRSLMVLALAFAAGRLRGMAPAPDVEPRTSIQQLSGSASAVHVIAEPGSYFLDGNLSGEAGKHAIQVDADDVTIRLYGFSLKGTPGSLNGIYDGGQPRENVAVIDGAICGFDGAGVSLQATRYGVMQDLSISRNGDGLRLGEDFIVSGCSSNENQKYGIGLLAGGCVVDSSARDNDEQGLYNLAYTTALVADSRFFDNLVWPGARALVTDCEFEESLYDNNSQLLQTGEGALVAGSAFRSSSINRSGIGLYPGFCNLVLDNDFSGLGYGISVTHRSNWLTDNRSVNCYGAIVTSNTSNLITNNMAIDSEVGFKVGSGNSYGRILRPSGYISDRTPWANVWR